MPRSLLILLVAGVLAGCSHLLPGQNASGPSAFDSFASAQRAVEQVVPFKTTVDDLRTLGFDVHGSANVTLIPYPELVARLAPNPSVPFDALDAGIRECILSRMACEAFEFYVGRESRQRVGGFWEDFLNFRRVTSVTGWHFKSVIAVRNGVVLFRNYGGEPHTDRTERQNNPLGPLQPAGEAAGSLLTR
jgi:hypothetical protein